MRVEGQLVLNGTVQVLNAALAGFGLAYAREDPVQPHLAQGRLERGARRLVLAFSGDITSIIRGPPLLTSIRLAD